jgi:single-strand DNA-binding protein
MEIEMSINIVILEGRLGQDPELKYIPNGTAVCNFSIATSESWKDKSGNKQEKTEWHRIVVWGKLAELCNQYLCKGKQAIIEGSLQTRSYEDKDKKKCYTTEIVAKNVQFIGGKPHVSSRDDSDNSSVSDDSGSTETNFTSDDIPF